MLGWVWEEFLSYEGMAPEEESVRSKQTMISLRFSWPLFS
jgi:hypothetical protein